VSLKMIKYYCELVLNTQPQATCLYTLQAIFSFIRTITVGSGISPDLLDLYLIH